MPNNAPLQNTAYEKVSPHDTTRKPINRRQIRKGLRTEEESLRILCHYQGLLIELLTEKVADGNA